MERADWLIRKVWRRRTIYMENS